MARLAFVGDVMLGRGVDEALLDMQPEEPWGDLLPLLLESDARVINLECALTDHSLRWRWSPKVFYFRARPAAVNVLRAARISACSLANNHTLDFEEAGLSETLAVLDRAGIQHAGAGEDLDGALEPAVFEAGALKIGLVAITDNEPNFAATMGRPGTRYVPVTLDDEVIYSVAEQIEAARSRGAQIVIVSDHWGPNMRLRPTPLFRLFARAMIDAGADLFFGHSAHLYQGVELYRGRPIFYDTGNFIDDYAVDDELHNDWSFLFRVTFDGRSLSEIELIPAKLSYARVDRARGSEAEAILSRMENLCGELGTSLRRAEGRLLVELSPAGAVQGTAPAGPT
jgi:poly-gamma-glutamate synthesis protein (capsule biosynthesis protein)